jgi:hypothetical protein
MKILVKRWYFDHHLLCTKPWHPPIDAKEEVISDHPNWIKLPNLPLEFWIHEG